MTFELNNDSLFKSSVLFKENILKIKYYNLKSYIFFLAFGAMTGALILYFTKIKGRRVILLIFIIVAVLVPLTPAFLIHCPSVEVAGITASYSDGLVNVMLV